MAKVIGYIPPKKEVNHPLNEAPEVEQKDGPKGKEINEAPEEKPKK